jgi:glycerophosphoryl diester phosphodiesterase
VNQFLKHIADHDFLVIGHRGAAGLAAENTLQSFATALALHCPMIELDVYATAGEKGQTDLLVIHDDKLDRTTNGRGRIADFSTLYLRSLDAGEGQPIPYLEEVVELLDQQLDDTGTVAALNIELKGPSTANPVAEFLTNLTRIPVLVSSFDHKELKRFRELDTSTSVAPLYGPNVDEWPTTAAGLSAAAVNLSKRHANPQRVGQIREAGYRVFVYTVNTPGEAESLKKLGVSGVFTDFPDKLRGLMANNK